METREEIEKQLKEIEGRNMEQPYGGKIINTMHTITQTEILLDIRDLLVSIKNTK